MPRIWHQGCTLPPPGISGSTYAMNLKLTPGVTLDKISWWVTSSAMLLDSCAFYRPKTILLTSAKSDWWRHKSTSRKLPMVSFNLIAYLEPAKQDDHYFHAEILVLKFHLRSRQACLRMHRRFASPDFFMPKCSQGNFGFWSYLKKSPERGRCTPLKKQTNKQKIVKG